MFAWAGGTLKEACALHFFQDPCTDSSGKSSQARQDYKVWASLKVDPVIVRVKNEFMDPALCCFHAPKISTTLWRSLFLTSAKTCTGGESSLVPEVAACLVHKSSTQDFFRKL